MPTQITSAGITFNDATSLTSANIGTTQLVNGSVTAAKLGTNEQKQIAKAWVRCNPRNNINAGTLFPATYTQSGTLTVTVTTSTNHNLINGQFVQISILTGAANGGTFEQVTVVSPTVFTYLENSSQTTSGNLNYIVYSNPVGSSTQSGTTTITVTTAIPHGLTNGRVYQIDVVDGIGADGFYVITVVSPTVFTFTNPSSGTGTGTLVVLTPIINSSFNVSSVVYISSTAIGINFTTPMPDANYSVVGYVASEVFNIASISTTSFRMASVNMTDKTEVCAQVFSN
jgi:hypothetical protein